MARTNTEIVNNLPKYSVKRSQDFPSWLIVTCPWEDCGGDFLVLKSRWTRRLERHGTVITGRSCPYCFRVGRIPQMKR